MSLKKLYKLYNIFVQNEWQKPSIPDSTTQKAAKNIQKTMEQFKNNTVWPTADKTCII